MYWDIEKELTEMLNSGEVVFDKLFQQVNEVLEYHAFRLIDNTIVFNITGA